MYGHGHEGLSIVHTTILTHINTAIDVFTGDNTILSTNNESNGVDLCMKCCATFIWYSPCSFEN